jgi:hypothetical protein
MEGSIKRSTAAAAFAVLVLARVPSPGHGQEAARDDGAVCAVAREHVVRYPHVQVADLYKLAYQAAFGPRHAASDPGHVRARLMAEVEEIRSEQGASTSDGCPAPVPLIEPLLPDSSLVRVNLRPFLDARGDPETVLAAFLSTADEVRDRPDVFDRYWSCFHAMAEEGELRATTEHLLAYRRARERAGLPAVHHSEAYVAAYDPAYRVVLRERVTLPDGGPTTVPAEREP